MNKYELLFAELKKMVDPIKRAEKEESLFWEQFAFELIISILLAKQICFEASDDDVQPIVRDLNGTKKEIDFRIRILKKDVYFGVTHFYGRPKDFEKDREDVDIEISNLKRNGILQHGTGKITAVTSHKEYLNRRMVVRVAKEGKHKFKNDYLYIFFPKVAPGFGGGLDGISKSFTFSSKANYEYRPYGITGIIVFGEYIEKTLQHSRLQKDKLLIRTLSFDNCSKSMRTLLDGFDMNTTDTKLRNEQVRNILKMMKA